MTATTTTTATRTTVCRGAAACCALLSRDSTIHKMLNKACSLACQQSLASMPSSEKQVHPWLLTGWPEAHARPSSRILLAHDLHTSLVATHCSILAACWGRHRRRCAGRFPEAVRQLYQRREYPRDGPQASSIEISVFHAISCRSVVNEANNSRDQFWAQQSTQSPSSSCHADTSETASRELPMSTVSGKDAGGCFKPQ